MPCQPQDLEASGPVLVQIATGEASPLYFDRQVVQAADLTLDRQSHDRELARMRLYLHGWGVVAGLIPVIAGDRLTVSNGYGVTWTGDEIFLPEALSVGDILAKVWGCCGPGQTSCEMIDLAERRRLADRYGAAVVQAWLIARPVQSQGALRPALAAGCGPASSPLSPTRSCDIVSLELLCTLPEFFQPESRTCKDLTSAFCQSPEVMRPLDVPPGAQQNFLVLGQITATSETARFSTVGRRALLPMALVQDWLRSCICGIAAPVKPEPVPDVPDPTDPQPGPVQPPVTHPDPPSPWGDWGAAPVDLSRFVDRLVFNGFRKVPGKVPVDGPGPQPKVPDILTDPVYRQRLAGEGITTVNQLMATDSAKLAVVLGVTETSAAGMQAEVAPLSVFARSFGG